MPRAKPDKNEQDDVIWSEWTEICAEKIYKLAHDEFLILHIDDANNVFVQMVRSRMESLTSLLVEVSLGLIESPPLIASLLDKGWEPPGSYAEAGGSSPNFQVVWTSPPKDKSASKEDSREAAELIASTMRVILAVGDPQDITVERDNF